ncbi:MAG: hypothetical protein ACREE2_04130 [Stellaceae bacterium]
MAMRHRRAPSIAERVKLTGGRSSGFDYLRLSLAVAVIVVHSASTSYGHASDPLVWGGPQRVLEHLILPMFFALSGCLVAGSLERCSILVSFFGLRIVRIVPALAVEVALSALIFGPLLSSVDLRSYFTSLNFIYIFLILLAISTTTCRVCSLSIRSRAWSTSSSGRFRSSSNAISPWVGSP